MRFSRLHQAATAAALFSLLGLQAAHAAEPRCEGFEKWVHRTTMFLAPENSLAGIETAISLGMFGSEIDLMTTRDGKIIHIHDRMVDRTLNATGFVILYTLARIRDMTMKSEQEEFKDERVPTFEESLAAAKGRLRLMLDVKAADPKQVLETVLDADAMSWVVRMGHDAKLLELAPDFPYMAVAANAEEFRDLAQAGADYVKIRSPLCSAEFFDMARLTGAKAFVDLVVNNDDLETMVACITYGADAILTDYPKLLNQAFEQVCPLNDQ